jgi:hypothetical protein
MTYASPWFGILYAVAFISGIAAIVLGDRLDGRIGRILGVLVAIVAGFAGGTAVRGTQADVSGQPFALPTAAPLAIAIPERLGPPRARAAQLSIDVFSDAQHPSAPSQTMIVPFGDEIVAAGWAYDANAHARCAAVVLVVDGRPFPAIYGGPRTDVASAYGADHLASGYNVLVHAAALGAGHHQADVRCLDAAGAGFASPPLSFEVSP